MRTTKKDIIELGNTLAEMMNKKNNYSDLFEYAFEYGWGLVARHKSGGISVIISAKGSKYEEYMRIKAAADVLHEIN